MTTLLVLHSSWFLMFYCVSGNLPEAGVADSLSLDFGRCSLTLSERALLSFQKCLCAGAQKCMMTSIYSYWSSEKEDITPIIYGEMSSKANSTSIHYVCGGNCRRRMFSYKLDSFVCNLVQLDEKTSQCKKWLQCHSIIRLDSSVSTHCRRCIDIRWAHPEKIKVSIGNDDLLQHGQCPSERETTPGTASVQISPDLSLMSSKGSTILSNETTLSPIFPRTTLMGETTEESVIDSSKPLVIIIVPLALTIAVVVTAVTSICIIYRRRSKKACIQRSRNIYITPVDITYSSTEYLAQGYTDCNPLALNGCLHLSTLDRNSRIFLAMENEYSCISYPESCNQIPAHQTSRGQTGACCIKPSVNEYAEVTNIRIDLATTAMTNQASNKSQYANVTGLDPNGSSNTEVTSHTTADVVCAKVSELSEKSANKSSYSKINTASKRIDSNAGKHSSSTSKNPSFVCNDVEGAYKIMMPSTTNINENKNKGVNSSITGTQLVNKDRMYTRLRESTEPVSNVYDVLVTETDDRTLSSFLYTTMDTEDESTLDLCPLNKKGCTEEDRLNGNVYENNDNSGLDTKGNCINNAFIINGKTFSSAHGNSVMNDNRSTEPDSPYVNYPNHESELEQSSPTCYMNETSTSTHLSGNGYSTMVIRNKRGDDSRSGNDDKEKNIYVEIVPHDSSPP